jgi:hypothetical protein
MAEESCAPAVVLTADQLTLPSRARKWWWDKLIALHVDHKVLAAQKKPDAYCKDCQKMIVYAGSTGNLERHVSSVHSQEENSLKIQGQSSMTSYLLQTPDFELQLVRWIVLTYQSLSVVEHPAFKALIACVSPNLSIPSRRTVAARLDALESRARKGIASYMLNQHVSITADAWSSPTMDSYLSVTAHLLDES